MRLQPRVVFSVLNRFFIGFLWLLILVMGSKGIALGHEAYLHLLCIIGKNFEQAELCTQIWSGKL